MMVMARSLFKGTHMPARLRGEVVRHAVYLLNRLPTKALGERMPFEAWMGRKSHLVHLRVFGCVAYVKNTAPHLKKLDDRSSPMVYLGVEEGCKAHRLFDPRHGKLQVSRDVMFRENYEWTWNAGANNEEKVSEFMVVDAFSTDEVIVAADIEVAVEDVTTPTVVVTAMPQSIQWNSRQLHKDLEGTSVDATDYRRIIGCLRYLLHTRSDLSYSVGMASRYMERPTIMHHKAVKQILSDLAGDLDGRKSTSGMTFYFNESLVFWNSQKQKTVALSSCEAEFMAAATATYHALWLRSLASELTGVEPKPIFNSTTNFDSPGGLLLHPAGGRTHKDPFLSTELGALESLMGVLVTACLVFFLTTLESLLGV
ncbi:hypothetical protein ZIOFF_051704 [Zingiber officinale]|uniref:Retroviral polymerase SH3-like domain-containing protein n=1 Tax=Zingiber officinale TaxID=94328 RepID=A0A8J5FMD3_ZINOF|nr:hypothetical protein ZIOFF_051704 [Zingiber officinale]